MFMHMNNTYMDLFNKATSAHESCVDGAFLEPLKDNSNKAACAHDDTVH